MGRDRPHEAPRDGRRHRAGAEPALAGGARLHAPERLRVQGSSRSHFVVAATTPLSAENRAISIRPGATPR